MGARWELAPCISLPVLLRQQEGTWILHSSLCGVPIYILSMNIMVRRLSGFSLKAEEATACRAVGSTMQLPMCSGRVPWSAGLKALSAINGETN